MSIDIVSMLIGFVAGTATGAAGTYFGMKYTDRRREREATSRAGRAFRAIRKQMPELIAEMKVDLNREGEELIREFFVLPNRKVRVGGSTKRRFAYYEEEHDNLRGKLDILDGRGYLLDVTPGNTPIYRMTEEFAELVSRHG